METAMSVTTRQTIEQELTERWSSDRQEEA